MSLLPIEPNFTQRPTGIRALDQHMRDSTRDDHPQYQLSLGGVYRPEDYGAKGDGSTDDTAAVNAAIAAAATAGGGTVVFTVGRTYLCDEQITVPTTNIVVSGGANTGDTLPVQPPIRLTSFGGPVWDGYWTAAPVNGSPVLDLRYATFAKILTLGAGFLEIDHLALKSGGSDNIEFIRVVNTTVSIHDCSIQGNSSNSGRTCQQDFAVFGGTVATIGGASTDAFQGYGSKLASNFYDHIRAGSTLQTYANGIVIEDETFSITCGSNVTNGAPYVLNYGASGNTIRGALVEMTDQVSVGHYDYVVSMGVVSGGCKWNIFDGLMAWDANPSATTPNLGMVFCGSTCVGNVLSNLQYPLTTLPWTGGTAKAGQIWRGYDSGWQGITLGTGMSASTTCEVRRIDDVVYLRGVVTYAGAGLFGVTFSLPSNPDGPSFAPPQALGFSTSAYTGGTSLVATNIGIGTGGTVTVNASGSPTGCNFYLDGISYPAA